MEKYHGKGKTKISGTGGRIRKAADKKLHLAGSPFGATKIGEKEVRIVSRHRGNTHKIRLKVAAFANVLTKDGMKKVRIKNVTETPDNRHYARQNLITKGAVIDSEIGKIKVTNRVGQDGGDNFYLDRKSTHLNSSHS